LLWCSLRNKVKKDKARLQDYEMIVKNDMSVLGCLEKIRIEQDKTLSQESKQSWISPFTWRYAAFFPL
jgi:hypothetical protein